MPGGVDADADVGIPDAREAVWVAKIIHKIR
jgi:hypothetical protein